MECHFTQGRGPQKILVVFLPATKKQNVVNLHDMQKDISTKQKNMKVDNEYNTN